MTLRRMLMLMLLAGCLPALAAAAKTKAAKVPQPVAPPPRADVSLVEVHDTMQPERADLLEDALEQAVADHADAVILKLSSPGGLPDSTDRMVDAIRSSTVPVIVWVGTPASRVSGQALRLVAAADVALIAPTAYLTPLWSEVPRGLRADTRSEDSRHLTQSLSNLVNARGRNASAVDELSSGIHWFTGREAMQAGFVDGMAEREIDVLRWVTDHGYRRDGVHHDLNLTGARLTPQDATPKAELLAALMNPNLCVLLLTLGLLLIYLEINTPGVILPGAGGVLLVLLAGYSLARLPLSVAGLGLCCTGLVLLLLEAHLQWRGILAAVGILAVVSGLARLVQGPLPQLQVHWATAIGAGLGFGGITASLMLLGLEARRTKIRTGAEAMLGWLAVAHTTLAPEGQVLVRGELWRARLTTNDGTVAAGDHVKVLRADGMTLEVTAVPLVSAP